MTDTQLQRLAALVAPMQDHLPPGIYVDCLHFFSGAGLCQ
jgi:hypothetical protein